jgi:capsular exopolysaccharide synthesis family protein
LERKTGLPVLATISHYEKKNSLAVYDSPRSPLAESFRGLRTNLQYFATDKAHKVIMLTSTISGEGKTFMGTNLATVLAMAGKRTVLLGFDLRKTSLHETFELTNNTGISSYLIGKDKLQDIVYKTAIPDLYVAPSGPLPPNPAELIETDRMDTLMTELKNDFDYVIIDTPPIAIVTDAMLLSRYADVNLLIVRQGFSRKGVYDFIQELKAGGKLKNPALVVNDARAKGYGKYYMQKYGYGYGYGYGYEG